MGSENHAINTPEELAESVRGALDEITVALRTEDAERYIELTGHLFFEKPLVGYLSQLRYTASQSAQSMVADYRRSIVEPTERLLSLLKEFDLLRRRQEPPASVLTGVPGTGFALRQAHLESGSQWAAGRRLQLVLPAWLTRNDGPVAVMGLPSPRAIIELLSDLYTRGKELGLLALDEDIESLPAPIAAVLQLIVDGTDPKLIERFWNSRVHDVQSELAYIHRTSVDAAQTIVEGRNPRLVSEIVQQVAWVTAGIGDRTSYPSAKEAPTVGPVLASQRGASELFQRVAEAVLKSDPINEEPDVAAILGSDVPPWIRDVTRLLFAFRHRWDTLKAAIDLYFDRLNRELRVVSDLVMCGALLIQSPDGHDFTSRLEALVPIRVTLTPEQTGHIGSICETWRNPEPVFRSIESLAFLAEDVRTAALQWNVERAEDVVEALRDEQRLSALIEELESDSGRNERQALQYADAVHAALSSSLAAVDEREGELTRLYARHTVTPASVGFVLTDRDRREFVDRIIELYRKYELPLDEYVRGQMELRNAELERLLEDFVGSGIGQQWSEHDEPSISAFRETSSLDLALRATPFVPDERHDLIQRWSRTDAVVGRELAARDGALEDLARLSDRSIQKVLREVSTSVLARALTDAPPRVLAAVTRNMSHRAEQLLLEDMEYARFAFPNSRRKAVQDVVALMRQLRDAGEIEALYGDDGGTVR